MPNDNDSNSPAADSQSQPPPEKPMAPSAPQQDKMRKNPETRSESEETKSIQLEEAIRGGERWPIRISAAAVILNAVIALIYYGQLKEMRKATRASVKAADAAASAADTADKTLKEIRAGSTDTHDLAVAAKAANADAEARFRIEQRPLLWTEPVLGFHNNVTQSLVQELGDGRAKYRANVHIVNGGKSPAIEVLASKLTIKVGPAEQVREEIGHADLTLPPTAGSTIIMPGSWIVPFSPGEDTPILDTKQRRLLDNNAWEMYMIGRIVYRDIYSPRLSVPYETRYCYQIVTQGMNFGGCKFPPSYIR